MTAMRKRELAANIAKNVSGFKVDQITEILDWLGRVIIYSIRDNPDVTIPIPHIGRFCVVHVKERKIKSNIYGTYYTIPEHDELRFEIIEHVRLLESLDEFLIRKETNKIKKVKFKRKVRNLLDADALDETAPIESPKHRDLKKPKPLIKPGKSKPRRSKFERQPKKDLTPEEMEHELMLDSMTTEELIEYFSKKRIDEALSEEGCDEEE